MFEINLEKNVSGPFKNNVCDLTCNITIRLLWIIQEDNDAKR